MCFVWWFLALRYVGAAHRITFNAFYVHSIVYLVSPKTIISRVTVANRVRVNARTSQMKQINGQTNRQEQSELPHCFLFISSSIHAQSFDLSIHRLGSPKEHKYGENRLRVNDCKLKEQKTNSNRRLEDGILRKTNIVSCHFSSTILL